MSISNSPVQLYNDGADDLLNAESFPDRVSLLPAQHGAPQSGSRIRVMWGQDLLADESAQPEAEVMERADSERRSQWLRDAMIRLNDRERMIIEERRLREAGSTLEALGQRLGISKERVRQIEAGAFKKLREALVEGVGDPYEMELIPAE